MAFATSLLKPGVTAEGLKTVNGKWTGTVGDADGTLSLKGARVYSAEFLTNNSAAPGDKPNVFHSTSSGTITLTVGNRGTVTNGSFRIIYL